MGLQGAWQAPWRGAGPRIWEMHKRVPPIIPIQPLEAAQVKNNLNSYRLT